MSPVIEPPFMPEDGGRPDRNPLLPPGLDRDDSPRSGAGSREEEADEEARRPRTDRGRSGLLGGLFGRFSGRAPGPPDVPGTDAPSGMQSEMQAVIDPEDPIAVASLKRELERQIVRRSGGRLASLEVLIVGRRVHLRAQPARVWQRRAVRRELEELAMPSGFLSTVEVR